MAITGLKLKDGEDPRWLLSIQEFGWSEGDAVEFLRKRERILRKATEAGVPRDVFLPFEPSRPGFEQRIKALAALPEAMEWE